jgi:hypothetical protein
MMLSCRGLDSDVCEAGRVKPDISHRKYIYDLSRGLQ